MWRVTVKEKVSKGLSKLPRRVRVSLDALVRDICLEGPVRGNWPNYSRLGTRKHHCHLKKGHPTYVAVWEESATEIQLVEVIYAGTHEKAPY